MGKEERLALVRTPKIASKSRMREAVDAAVSRLKKRGSEVVPYTFTHGGLEQSIEDRANDELAHHEANARGVRGRVTLSIFRVETDSGQATIRVRGRYRTSSQYMQSHPEVVQRVALAHSSPSQLDLDTYENARRITKVHTTHRRRHPR